MDDLSKDYNPSPTEQFPPTTPSRQPHLDLAPSPCNWLLTHHPPGRQFCLDLGYPKWFPPCQTPRACPWLEPAPPAKASSTLMHPVGISAWTNNYPKRLYLRRTSPIHHCMWSSCSLTITRGFTEPTQGTALEHLALVTGRGNCVSGFHRTPST